MTKTYKVQITTESYDEKPTIDELKAMQRAIAQTATNVTKEQLAQLLVNGHSVSGGVLEPGVATNADKHVQYNEVLMVDFDNDHEDGVPYTMEDVKSHPWVKSNVAFLYETFSSRKADPDRERFRAVIFLKEQIKPDEVEGAYRYIYDMLKDYPMDVSTKNASRLFHGSQAGKYEAVDMNNEWLPRQKAKPERKAKSEDTVTAGVDTIEYDEGLAIMEAYVKVNHSRLVSDANAQNYYLDAMFTLYGNFLDEQLSEDQVLDYAEVLAAGDSEWAENNRDRMGLMIEQQEDPKEYETFRDKFQRSVAYGDKNSDIAKDYIKRVGKENMVDDSKKTKEAVVKHGFDRTTINGVEYELKDLGHGVVVAVDDEGRVVKAIEGVQFADDKRSDLLGLARIAIDKNKGHWVNGTTYLQPNGEAYWVDEGLLRIIADTVGETNKRDDAEILHQLEKYAPMARPVNTVVQLKSNHHIDDGVLVEGHSSNFTPYYMDVEYDPDAYSKDVDEFLNFMSNGSEDMRTAIEQQLGHIITRASKPAVIYFYNSPSGGTGKSTLLDMIMNFVNGEHADPKEDARKEQREYPKPSMASGIQIEELGDNTSAITTTKAMVNIGDETKTKHLGDITRLKTLSAGGTFELRGSYGRTTSKARSTATYIFANNGMPIIDNDGGLERRLFIFPFYRKIADHMPLNNLIDYNLSTPEAHSYILNLALKGAKSLQDNGGQLLVPREVSEANREYLKRNDPVKEFIEEHENIIPNKHWDDVYDTYKEWCNNTLTHALSRKNFRPVMETNGYKRVRSGVDIQRENEDGSKYWSKRPWIFVKDDVKREDDPFELFLKDYGKVPDNLDWTDVWEDYHEFTEALGGTPLIRKRFAEQLEIKGYKRRRSTVLIEGRDGVERRPTVFEYTGTKNAFV